MKGEKSYNFQEEIRQLQTRLVIWDYRRNLKK